MSEDKSLEENSAGAISLNPGMTIGGIGDPVLPTATTVGSGDVLDVADIDDDEEEAKKDKTKKKLEMESFNLHTQFSSFLNEGKIPNFKFGQRAQYTPDDINTEYGFWGTLDIHMDSESIEEIWNDVWGILTKSWKFSDAGALYYLNAKAGRHLADKVWNDINAQISQPDAIDIILSNYVRPSQWKAWAKEYNEFAQEELAESVVTESVFSFKTDNVEQLHFETDPKTAELMKIEIGASQGEVTRKKQIEGGEYSLRRFRKEIKYGDGKDLGVFLPGSYDAATSKLGDGPHKKAVKKVKWNRKKYDQWLEDVASNDGWRNAYDMAQNAKHEPGLLQWAKKEFRGEDVMQRIQWDIEAFAESVVTEAEKYDTKGFKKGDKIKTNFGEWEVIETDYAPKKSFTAPFIFKGKDLKRVDIPNPPKTNKNAVGYKVTDGAKYPTIGFLYQYKDITKLATIGVDESVTGRPFTEWYKLNEAKDVSRDEMMKWIKKYMDFVGTTEEFSGSQGGIHVSGEDGDEYKGSVIYHYYSEDYKNREFGVWNKWEKELNKRGWYSEWYDAGTVCIWPL